MTLTEDHLWGAGAGVLAVWLLRKVLCACEQPVVTRPAVQPTPPPVVHVIPSPPPVQPAPAPVAPKPEVVEYFAKSCPPGYYQSEGICLSINPYAMGTPEATADGVCPPGFKDLGTTCERRYIP